MRKRKAKLHVIDSAPPCEDTVRVLEEMLERAKVGDLSSVAVATVHRDGSVGSIWSEVHNLGCMAGAIARMQYRILGGL